MATALTRAHFYSKSPVTSRAWARLKITFNDATLILISRTLTSPPRRDKRTPPRSTRALPLPPSLSRRDELPRNANTTYFPTAVDMLPRGLPLPGARRARVSYDIGEAYCGWYRHHLRTPPGHRKQRNGNPRRRRFHRLGRDHGVPGRGGISSWQPDHPHRRRMRCFLGDSDRHEEPPR